MLTIPSKFAVPYKKRIEAIIRNIVPTLRRRWPDQLNTYSDEVVARLFDDFYLNDNVSNNYENFPRWFPHLTDNYKTVQELRAKARESGAPESEDTVLSVIHAIAEALRQHGSFNVMATVWLLPTIEELKRVEAFNTAANAGPPNSMSYMQAEHTLPPLMKAQLDALSVWLGIANVPHLRYAINKMEFLAVGVTSQAAWDKLQHFLRLSGLKMSESQIDTYKAHLLYRYGEAVISAD